MYRLGSRIIAAFVAVSVAFTLWPKPAYAYVTYGDGYNIDSSPSAAYQYILDHGGSSNLPALDDASAIDFFLQVLTAPSSPLYYFCVNYCFYVPTIGWRVTEASDIVDVDARFNYEDRLQRAIDFLENEWAVWVEEYPGAGGSGSSSAPSLSHLHVAFLDTLDSSYVFDDGTVLDLSSAQAGYNLLTSSGAKAYVISSLTYGNKPNAQVEGFTNNNYLSLGYAPVGKVGLSIRSKDIADSLGYTDNLSSNSFYYYRIADSNYNHKIDSSYALLATSSGSSVGIGGQFDQSSTNTFIVPSGFYYYGRSSTGNYLGGSDLYIITNASIWLYDHWIDSSSVGPSDEPIGPTAPDYEPPSDYTPVNPTLPNITNNITNNGGTYTGNETDYTDYLKIIIDNQNTQIDQLHDLGALIDSNWDAFNSWLNSELDNVLGYLYNIQQHFNTLLEWQKSITGYLYSIDRQMLYIRQDFSNFTGTLWGWLRSILSAIPDGSSQRLPDVTVDDGEGGGFFNWLYDLLDKVIDKVVGSDDEVAGIMDDLRALTGVFPFSLPWDLLAVLSLLQHEPVSDYTIQYPILDGATEDGSVTWSYRPLDLSPFAPVFTCIGFGFFGLAVLALIHATKDMLEVLDKVVGS